MNDPSNKFSEDTALNILGKLAEQAEEQKKDTWHSYQIELITPIFGGGIKAGEPDTKMPVRTSAIRGQLRYWWRFLAKQENEDWSKKKLFEEERKIWGGMAEPGKDYSSKVLIKIEAVHAISPKEYPEK
ncbi:MAG: type III-B CRISPR module RAMP protein Cmr1, partial [Candidatus Electrothrix sp. AR3]|nr:type III-B CRISPR module RAMP protein Cmr1 [Candidatus Electrothrix sp. AR3]